VAQALWPQSCGVVRGQSYDCCLRWPAATEAKDNYGKMLLLYEFGSGHEPR